VGVVGPKRWVKLLEYGFRFFHIFGYFILFNKYGNRYENRIGCHIDRNTIVFSYHLFLDWTEKFNNFSDFLHCSSGLSRWAGSAIFFLLIQRVLKYLNNSNL
jgi:hypothetical protein